jgi:hypothetical protein
MRQCGKWKTPAPKVAKLMVRFYPEVLCPAFQCVIGWEASVGELAYWVRLLDTGLIGTVKTQAFSVLGRLEWRRDQWCCESHNQQ